MTEASQASRPRRLGTHRPAVIELAGSGARADPIQRPREPNVLARDAPRHLEPGDEPGRGREEAVALVQAPAIDLGEPAEPFDLELLHRTVQLGEVLLDPRVREIRQRLGSQRIHGGT